MLHGRTELAGPRLPDLLHACESSSVELFGPVHTSIVKSTMAFAIQVIKLKLQALRIMATSEPEHQATQEVEEAQGLHRKRGGVQKAPVAPGAVFKVIVD